jgi:hypothetical protein
LNARSSLAAPQIVEVAALAPAERSAMYALYERYYAGTSFDLFAADLAEKDSVIVLRDDGGALQGFSTLAVLFSGDTVVDERRWGQQALAFMWLRHAGAIKARQPTLPLYWLLISKGHRTFRYLPAFSRTFVPFPGASETTALHELRDFLARDRFGANYDVAAGLVRFAEPRGRLQSEYAEVPPAHRRLPAVQFFLRCNPNYRLGEELVCVCELEPGNLRPIARRAFCAGLGDA